MTSLLKFAIRHGSNFIKNNHDDVLRIVLREAITEIKANAKGIAFVMSNKTAFNESLIRSVRQLQADNKILVPLLNGIRKKLAVKLKCLNV